MPHMGHEKKIKIKNPLSHPEIEYKIIVLKQKEENGVSLIKQSKLIYPCYQIGRHKMRKR
jgi:hypothetical protein